MGKRYSRPSSFYYGVERECRGGGNKISNVRSFIILRSGEGLTSINTDNNAIFSGKTKAQGSFPGYLLIYFLSIREKSFSQTRRRSRTRIQRSLQNNTTPGCLRNPPTKLLNKIFLSVEDIADNRHVDIIRIERVNYHLRRTKLFRRAVAFAFTYPEVSFLFVDGNCQFVHFTHDLVPFCTFKKLGTLLQQIH